MLCAQAAELFQTPKSLQSNLRRDVEVEAARQHAGKTIFVSVISSLETP